MKTEFTPFQWVTLTEDYGANLKAGETYQLIKPQTENKYCWEVDHLSMGIESTNFLAPYTEILRPATRLEISKAIDKALGIETEPTYTVDKPFLLRAHLAACPTWQKELEEKFPDAFKSERLEVGKWYKSSFSENLTFYATKVTEDGIEGYGDVDGWESDWSIHSDSNYGRGLRLATPQEVESMLTAEFTKLGFKANKDIKLISGLVTKFTESEAKNIFLEDGKLFVHSNLYCVFDNGKFAEIISEPIEPTLEQRVENIEKQLKIKK